MTRILEILTEGPRSMTMSFSFPLISELKDIFPDPASGSPLRVQSIGLEQCALRSYMNVQPQLSPPTALQSSEPLSHVPGLLASAAKAQVLFE